MDAMPKKRETPGEKMRKVRERANYTRDEFGWILGYRGTKESRNVQIKRWEYGSRKMPKQMELLMAYMDAYGAPKKRVDE